MTSIFNRSRLFLGSIAVFAVICIKMSLELLGDAEIKKQVDVIRVDGCHNVFPFLFMGEGGD